MLLQLLRQVVICTISAVALSSPAWTSIPPTVSNTLPNIIARLTEAGEKVQIVAQATDPAGVNWVILSRENPEGRLNYSLVKTIGGGADGVLDGINVPMQIIGRVNTKVIEPLILNYIRYLLESHGNDLEATQKFVTDHEANFSGAPDQIRLLFSQYGIQLP